MLPGSGYLLFRYRLRGWGRGRGQDAVGVVQATVTTPENARRRRKRGRKAAERGWPALERPCAQQPESLPPLEAKARAKAVVTDATGAVGGMERCIRRREAAAAAAARGGGGRCYAFPPENAAPTR